MFSTFILLQTVVYHFKYCCLVLFLFSRSLLEEWICAKYLREEFSRPERQSFLSGNMEGFLMKRGKEDPRYHPRKFTLSEVDDTLKYYVKEVRIFLCFLIEFKFV